MANINKLKMGSSAPDAIMFDTYYLPTANQFVSFDNIIDKNTTWDIDQDSGEWEINDDWDITFVTPRIMRINKFKIDTWGIRQKHTKGSTILSSDFYRKFSVKVEGLSYVHQNIIKATAGSEEVTGFVPAYCGTGGWIAKWYPGCNTSGNYVQGLVIQGIGCYTASFDGYGDSAYTMGRAPWEISSKDHFVTDGIRPSGVMVGESRGVCIGLFGGVQNATAHLDNANGAYRIYDISDHPIYIYLDVPDSTAAVDVSSIECWDVYVGNTQVYHKDKTVGNCWIKYKLAQMHTVSECSALEVKDLSGISNKKILPNVINWQNYMEDYTDNTVYPTKFVQFHISISNTDYWDTIREWFANHNICALVLECGKIFQNSNFSGELVLNIDHPRSSSGTSYQFVSFSSAFENTSITKLTLNLLNGCRISSLHNMFIRMSSLQQINWNSNNVTCAATDLSGAFEWDGSLISLPSNMIEWGSRAQFGITPNGSTNFGYVFEGCTSLTSIPMYGENRTADANTVIASFVQQAFNACRSLTYIGPVIDLRYINPGSSGYLTFGSCTNVTDARIKNLNHNTWYLDGTGTGNNNHGNLPLLDLESVQYLFNNLVDLNKKNSNPPRSLSNCFVDWNRQVNEKEDNFAQFSSIYFHLASASGTDASSPCYTNGTFENLVISVSGLTSGLRLEFGSGIIEQSDSSITTNGRHTINKSNSDVQGFKLYNDTNEDISTNVAVSIVNPYDDSTPVNDSAELHCPSAWSDKITDEMVQTANTKGWTIYIGGTEKVV